MKNSLLIALLLFSIFSLIGCSDSSRGYVAKITVKIVNEANKVIDGAAVNIGFLTDSGKNSEVLINGTVNSEGLFTAEEKTNGLVGGTVMKDGYYNSTIDYPFTKKVDGRWMPWNPVVTVVLRKIENPVPMYARKAEIQIPEIDKEIGFDLIQYDWTKPYGKGKHADFVFKVTRKYVNRLEFNGTLTISTPTNFDGIQLVKENRRYGSMFKLPRNAPEKGYGKKVVKTITAFPGKSIKSDSEEDNNYIFKIRSEQKDGKFNRAMYGKIQGDFVFMVGEGKPARIAFKYYLNPDYTTNLEFDPKKNLFQGLSSFDSVALD